jgi:hypothetical protein
MADAWTHYILDNGTVETRDGFDAGEAMYSPSGVLCHALAFRGKPSSPHQRVYVQSVKDWWGPHPRVAGKP